LSHAWLGDIGIGAAIGVAYFLAARLGLALRTKPEALAIIWPAAGIAVGALIALGPRARLPVAGAAAVATIACNLLIGRHAGLALTFGLINAGQALLTAWLIERRFGSAFKLSDVPQVVGFIVASTIGAAVAAAAAAVSVSLVDPTTSASNVWRLWFASCSLGVITVAPLVIGLGEAVRELPPRRELVEGAAALATLAVLSVLLVFLPQGPWATALPVALVFPLLLWVAVRCRPVFAAAAAFMVALAVIWSTNFSEGHFADEGLLLKNRILATQTLVLAGALLVLILAALFDERRRNEMILKVSNERLKDSNQCLQLALSGAKLGAFSLDVATGRIECDALAAHIHGHAALPRTIKDGRRFIHPEDRANIDAAFAGAPGAGGVCSAEYRVVLPPGQLHAGEVRWVAFEGSVSCDAQGTPVRLLGVTRDITHRRQAEQALADRNSQLALAGEVALVGSFVYDIASGTMQVSRGYAAIHGLPEACFETTRAEWRARVHPEDLPLLEARHQEVFAECRQEHHCEYRIVRSGETRWIEARSLISYDRDGRPQRIVGANIDVTERKQTEAVLEASESRLADALAAGHVMAFEWDAATGRSRRSDNAALILGDEKGSLLGSPRNDFLGRVHAEDRPSFKAHIRELHPRNPSYVLSFRFCRSDGRQVWLEESAKGEFDASGRLLRIKGLTRDITERKQLEGQKNILIAELDHRVKNALALVSAIASRTQETSTSMAAFVSALEGRIASMARTHELLSGRRWHGIPLAELVQRELAPYATGGNTRLEGTDDILSAEAGQPVAMVFHELATHAAKFGALSAKGRPRLGMLEPQGQWARPELAFHPLARERWP